MEIVGQIKSVLAAHDRDITPDGPNRGPTRKCQEWNTPSIRKISTVVTSMPGKIAPSEDANSGSS